jgi:hypothetical protein
MYETSKVTLRQSIGLVIGLFLWGFPQGMDLLLEESEAF